MPKNPKNVIVYIDETFIKILITIRILRKAGLPLAALVFMLVFLDSIFPKNNSNFIRYINDNDINTSNKSHRLANHFLRIDLNSLKQELKSQYVTSSPDEGAFLIFSKYCTTFYLKSRSKYDTFKFKIQ